MSGTASSARRTHAGTGAIGTDGGGALVLRRVRVRVVGGASRGREALLEEGTLILGSHPDVDLRIEDPTVSRYHVELAMLSHGVRVRDLESTNGTFVGSSRIESAVISPGSEIRVGKARVELLPADVPAPDAPSEATRFGPLRGATPAMRKVFGVLERVAPSDVSILIEGEAGVGKSEAARTVHRASPRADAPFHEIDLGARLEEGHVEKVFEASAGGTVVLDRVDAVTAPVAAELLHVLERVERTELDVRVVATSRTDFRARVEAGAAPRDLYFHLAAVRVVIPPLRERLDDLSRLVRDLMDQLGHADVPLELEELAALRTRDFPGNVRELARTVEETLVRSGRASVPPTPAPELTPDLVRTPFKEAKERLVDTFEREYVARLLDRHGGNLSRAAAEAGLDRNYLSRLAKKHGLR